VTKFRQAFTEHKNWVWLITYAGLLWVFLNNLSAVFGVLHKFLQLMTPFFYAVGVAFVLNIPMKQCEGWIEKHTKENSRMRRGRRTWAITYAFVLALLIIVLFGWLIIPPLLKSIGSFFTNLVNIINGLVNNTDQLISYLNLNPIGIQVDSATIQKAFADMGLDWSSIVEKTTGYLSANSSTLLNNLASFSASMGNWLLGIMLSIYLLASKETMIRQAKKLVAAVFPVSASKEILRVCRQANVIFSNFISGQLVEALIIGGLEYLMMLLFRIPYAVLIACIVTVMALVPVFGATLACVIGFLLVFSVSPWQAVLFVILYQCTQQFENMVIYPRVVGKSVGLPAIWTLLSIIVFGGLFGVFGMLVAVPSTALLYSLGSEFVNKALARRRLQVTTEEVTPLPDPVPNSRSGNSPEA